MLNEAATRIAALESELEEAKRQEEAVHLTILAATAAKDDMLEAARHQAGELTDSGRKEGDRIVTDARMQAFQLVTGARKEAETIVVEARSEAAAVARVDDESEVSPDGPTEREKALQERIDEMQHVVAAMELELSNRPTAAEFEAAIAKASAADAAAADSADNVEDSPTPPDAAPPTPAAEDHDQDIEIVVNDAQPVDPCCKMTQRSRSMMSPSPSRPIPDPRTPEDARKSAGSITDARTPEAVRRSFYSRRSARLPRIGAEGGRDTMATIAGLRTNFVAADATVDADPEDKPAFEAV